MIRLLSILLGAALIAAGIAWIADRQGELLFTIGLYEVKASASVAIGLAIAFTALVAVLTRIIVLVVSGPGALGRWSSARRMRRGNEAIAQGLVAAAAGDALEARRQAKRAENLLGSPPLSLLLAAQAAQLEGDESAQGGAYKAMLEHPETEFLGLRGLFMQAMRREDGAEAIALASRALVLKPKAIWAMNALFDLQSARGQWVEAKKILENAARKRLLDVGLLRRRRGVLLAAEALDAENRGDGERALAAALEALDFSPALAPAATLAARRLAQTGRAWRAQDIIEGAWAQAPHPDMAAVYAAIRPAESVEERASRLVGLAHLNRDHFESRVLEAEQAINIMHWAEARRVLAPLSRGPASVRVCALMAEIEQGENQDAGAAHAWLSRAARAPRDADWRCANCSWTSPQWHAVCGQCGAFDSLSWSAPEIESLSMLPGAPRDERLASDAASAFLQAPDETEDENAPTRAWPPRPARRGEDVDGARGFVMPRQPDDPGPDGHDFEHQTDDGGF
ncbi:MAG TPA: heme biosynthesis HemY N-terminal domain-containing protein [Rhizomicrobium sp.]|jgi:HemY protein|nr:heme biosynthesis HemY N-terminal domain-containing protein [Rhizomicrobium sp.]